MKLKEFIEINLDEGISFLKTSKRVENLLQEVGEHVKDNHKTIEEKDFRAFTKFRKDALMLLKKLKRLEEKYKETKEPSEKKGLKKIYKDVLEDSKAIKKAANSLASVDTARKIGIAAAITGIALGLVKLASTGTFPLLPVTTGAAVTSVAYTSKRSSPETHFKQVTGPYKK